MNKQYIVSTFSLIFFFVFLERKRNSLVGSIIYSCRILTSFLGTRKKEKPNTLLSYGFPHDIMEIDSYIAIFFIYIFNFLITVGIRPTCVDLD